MRLPFISRRSHENAIDFLAAVQQSNLNDARMATFKAEAELTLNRMELDRERAKRDRLKAYMLRTHTARYEQRIGRLRRAVAAERAQAEAYRREIRQLTDRLFDACGYQGEPLLPAARATLGIEDAKEES